MTLLIFLIALTLNLNPAVVDLGSPSINAVCKIKLIDGKEIEGMLCIIQGGYSGYQQNGFGYRYDNLETFQYKLFHLSQYAIRANSGSSRLNRSTGLRERPTLYYLKSNYKKINRSSWFCSSEKTHVVEENRSFEYNVQDSLTVHHKIPIKIHFTNDIDESQTYTTPIKVSDISSFTLIDNVSDDWLHKIKRARMRIDNDDSTSWVDYLEPLWYHEIRADKNKYQKLIDFIGNGKQPGATK